MRQIELIEEIKRIQPKYFILDTAVAPHPAKLFHILPLTTRIRLKHFVHIKQSLTGLKAKGMDVGHLVFRYEDYIGEGATIEPVGLVAYPTKSLVETLFKSHGFTFRQLHWNKKDIETWTKLEDYKTGKRVSYISQLF